MNSPDDLLFDHRIADWLEQDPKTAPSSALDVVLAAFPSVPQRRTWRASWRSADREWFRLAAAGAAAVVIVLTGVIGLNLFVNQQPGIGAASPLPSVSPASPEPTSGLP